MFGEGTFDSFQRIKDQALCDHWYESIKISKGKYVDVGGLTPATTPLPTTTPNAWSTMGIGVNRNIPSFIDTLNHFNLENKFNSITPLPKAIPTYVAPISDTILSDVTSWKNTIVEKTSIVEASDFVKEWKYGKIASSSKIKVEEL